MAATHSADSAPAPADCTPRSRLFSAALWSAYAAAWAIVIPVELERWREIPENVRSIPSFLTDWNVDTTPFLIWLLTAPLYWFWPRSRLRRAKPSDVSATAADLPANSGPRWRAVLICLAVGFVSLANSAWIGNHFGNLPPAYHDEYSYLIQAQTFATGRVSYPSPPASDLFDQIHVLNLGKFASRYFPGTGAWLAPFFKAGHPLWGQWLASALAAVLFCLAGRELAGDFAGTLTGLLVALSPGIALFSNLILAHQPTLMGLGLFLYAWLRMADSKSLFWSVTCGVGLSFAMLCRPMTAAAVGLPFGLWLFIAGFRSLRRASPERFSAWMKLWAGVATPLLVGGITLFAYDRAITGNGWLTPYSEYTAVYTPRHVFGFDNVIKGEQHLGPRVMESYDLWAENLTPQLAERNAFLRLLASSQWTLGLIPLAMALVAGLILCRKSKLWLVLAAIIGLHVAHIPYWFVGIMNWHYVFESAPLWCLWFAVISRDVLIGWKEQGRRPMIAWWAGLVAIAIMINYIAVPGLWNQSRIGAAIGEVQYPRQKYQQFLNKLAALPQSPALVLIEGDSADRSFDLVVNEPDFRSRVIRGRYLPQKHSRAELETLFPNRRIILYKVREDRFGPAG